MIFLAFDGLSLMGIIHSSDLNTRLADRRMGGMVLVDYLFDLFAASPLEQFSRLSVLTLLDRVKKDKDLFPDDALRAVAGFPLPGFLRCAR